MIQKAAIQSAQMRQLFSASTVSLLTSVVLATILAYAQRDVISHTVILTWLSFVALASLLRAALVMAYLHTSENGEADVYVWLTRFRLLVLLSGIFWGSAGFILFPAGQPLQQMVLIIILVGLTSGAVVSFSADSVCSTGFPLPVLTPLMVRLFMAGGNLSVTIGVAVALYLGFMVKNSHRINCNIHENIKLKIEAAEREKSMSVTAALLKEAQRVAQIGSWRWDAKADNTWWSDELYRIFDKNPNTTPPKYADYQKYYTPESAKVLITAVDKALQTGASYAVDLELSNNISPKRWVLIRGEVQRDASNQIVGLQGTLQDITERTQLEQKRLAHEIALRSTLVREVHHRIKNSLQGVTGLLRQTLVQHPELRESVTNAISQIRSIAVIHGLQGSNQNSQIILQDIVKEITANNQSLWPSALVVNIQANLPKWKVTEEDAVPLALVVNELVLNAIKHSKPNSEVRIALHGDDKFSMTLTITNVGQLSQNSNTPHLPEKGTGLALLDFLLPEDGASLSWQQSGDSVSARLVLTSPVIAVI